MLAQRPVEGDEAEILNDALAQEKAVERIARCGLGLGRGYGVAMIDNEKVETNLLK